jgi:hypothetical protein
MNAVSTDRWRVFISHTAELRDFPKAKSYVSEVERAISAAGHLIVDMSDFPAADQPAAEICVERVRGCDVYVGVLGTRQLRQVGLVGGTFTAGAGRDPPTDGQRAEA